MAEIAALPRPGPAGPIDSPDALLAYERSLDCVHCGLCLPKCPTYVLTGREPSSPRGRIYLMRSWAEGRIAATERLSAELDFCLVCRACETVCPAGVRFGEMMEHARNEIGRARPDRAAGGFPRRFLLRSLLTSRSRMRRALALLRLYSFPPSARSCGLSCRRSSDAGKPSSPASRHAALASRNLLRPRSTGAAGWRSCADA